MKDKIIVFVIGVLVGAVINAGAFYIYTTTTSKCDCSNQNIQMNGSNPPEMPSEQNGQQPEQSSDDNLQNSNTKENN